MTLGSISFTRHWAFWAVFGALMATTSHAAPPANDDFDSAFVISAVPYGDVGDTVEATAATDDPSCSGNGSTVWYAYTPAADATIVADTFGSAYDTTLSVYSGVRGALTQLACNDDFNSLQSRVEFQATAGQTYYLMVGSFFSGPGGPLAFSVQELVRPPNDDFDDALAVAGLPYSDSRDVTAAGAAPDDPACGNPGNATVWYAFTAASTGRVEASTLGSSYFAFLSAWTGSRGSLNQAACGTQLVRFEVVAGETYYIMVSGFQGGSLEFLLTEAPPPFAIDVEVLGAASVVSTTGVATISGVVRCNQAGFVSGFGQVTQKIGSGAVGGFVSFSVSCVPGAAAGWSSVVSSHLRLAQLGKGRAATLFTGGRATVQVQALGFSAGLSEFAEDSVTTLVSLRGSRR